MLLFFILNAAIVILQAGHLSMEKLSAMPKSVEKDYYIWRFITSKNTGKSDAEKIIRQAWNINATLKKAYHR